MLAACFPASLLPCFPAACFADLLPLPMRSRLAFVPSCSYKLRKVTKREEDYYGASEELSWYCKLNEDSEYNSCEIVEEAWEEEGEKEEDEKMVDEKMEDVEEAEEDPPAAGKSERQRRAVNRRGGVDDGALTLLDGNGGSGNGGGGNGGGGNGGGGNGGVIPSKDLFQRLAELRARAYEDAVKTRDADIAKQRAQVAAGGGVEAVARQSAAEPRNGSRQLSDAPGRVQNQNEAVNRAAPRRLRHGCLQLTPCHARAARPGEPPHLLHLPPLPPAPFPNTGDGRRERVARPDKRGKQLS